MNDAGASLDRAKDKVSQMQARAAATDELLAQRRASTISPRRPTEDLEWQLAAGASSADIERQLKAMKDAAAAGSRDGAGANPNDPDGWKSIGQGSNAP